MRSPLERALARKQAKEATLKALGALGADDQQLVLADIFIEVPGAFNLIVEVKAPPAQQTPSAAPPSTVAPLSLVETAGGEAEHRGISGDDQDDDGEPLWQQVLEYCRSHPSTDGLYRTREVGPALLPDRDRTYAGTLVYLAVKRRSPQNPKGKNNPHFEPHFEWLGKGQFRLLAMQMPLVSQAEGHS